MRKLILILVIFLGGLVVAQSQPFEKGDKALNLGIGLGTGIYGGGGYSMRIPPITASFEMGVSDKLGIGYIGAGAIAGIAGSKYKIPGSDYGWNYTYIIIGGRAAYHFDLVDDLDIYAGLMAGVRITQTSAIGDPSGSPESTTYAHSEFVGIRWFFTPGFGLMAEVGYGISYLNIGVAFKF